MQLKTFSGLLAGAVVVSAQCTIPVGPLSGSITAPFRIQVQNISRPEVHDKYMNLLLAGGGDHHLFIGPVGNVTLDLTLVDGVINWERGDNRAVIGGEYSEIDHTTKMFMTGRGDPRAIFAPTYACNPDNPTETQVELGFVTWQRQPAGGWICVRRAFDGAHEFRYSPPGNQRIDVNRECIRVILVVRPWDGRPVTSTSTAPSVATSTARARNTTTQRTTTITTTTTRTSTSTSTRTAHTTMTTTTTTTRSTPVATTAPRAPFADMTSLGFRFIGCAPEERRKDPIDFYGRTLPDAAFSENNMTNERCLSLCAGYAYAGTEWSKECWCANSYKASRQPGTTLSSVANCNFRCSGNSAQFCGGDAWLSLYERCAVGAPCVNNVFT